MKIHDETLETLRALAGDNESVIVSYSGGKDSLVVMDLCKKAFPCVVSFFMYLIPGTSIMERQINYAKARWDIEVLQYPHWALYSMLLAGVYCDPRGNELIAAGARKIKMSDVYNQVRDETGISLIATGMKRADSMFRQRSLSNKMHKVIHPINGWNKFDIIVYCKENDIELPIMNNGHSVGVDLTSDGLIYLKQNHPEDFEKLLKIFPYAEVPIYQRMFYASK